MVVGWSLGAVHDPCYVSCCDTTMTPPCHRSHQQFQAVGLDSHVNIMRHQKQSRISWSRNPEMFTSPSWANNPMGSVYRRLEGDQPLLGTYSTKRTKLRQSKRRFLRNGVVRVTSGSAAATIVYRVILMVLSDNYCICIVKVGQWSLTQIVTMMATISFSLLGIVSTGRRKYRKRPRQNWVSRQSFWVCSSCPFPFP